jgi:hypothetical protein
VRQIVEYSLRWLTCLMACWLPFQSLAVNSGDCLCYCDKFEAECVHTHCSSTHCLSHKHSHCRRKPKRDLKPIANPLRPCDCLPTCPCHDGNSPASVDLTCAQQGQRLTSAETTSSLRFVVHDCDGAPKKPSAHPLPPLRWQAALAFCAALCRFTI